MVTLQIKAIRCGKPGCTTCPHSFYLYAYWKEGRKTKCQYIGKVGVKGLAAKIKAMGEWKQWLRLLKKHKKLYGGGTEKKERSSFRNNSTRTKQRQGETYTDEVEQIEKVMNKYISYFDRKCLEKLEKLLALIKDCAVISGERAAAISAIHRIFKRVGVVF